MEKLTTIVGENGSGKTAILDAIWYAMKARSAAARLTEQDFNNADLGDIEITLAFSQSFILNVPAFPTTTPVPCNGIRFTANRREKAAPGKLFCGGFVSSTIGIPDSSVKKVPDGWEIALKNGKPFEFNERSLRLGETEGLPQCFLFDKDRTRQAKLGYKSTLTQFADDLNWRFRRGMEKHGTDLLSQWNSWFDSVLNCIDRSRIDGTLKKWREQAESLLGNKLDNLELSPLNLETPFSKAFLSIRDGLAQVDQEAMGSGVAMILAITLLSAAIDADESFIVLIDEPELHLHPQLQRNFRHHLSGLGGQIIASTHAESMLDLGEWRTIKRLSRCGEVAPTPAALGAPMGAKEVHEHLDDISKYYKDKTLLLRENNELLFARGVVLVEGPIDRISLRSLSMVAGTAIDNLTIIAAWGKPKLREYQVICRAFDIPYFTVWDADTNHKDDNIWNADLKACSLKTYYHEFPKSFEAEFGFGKNKRASDVLDKVLAIKQKSQMPASVSELLGKLGLFNNSAASAIEKEKFAEEAPLLAGLD